MAIYVDSPTFPYRGQMYCHMATDSDIGELHLMATRIGLKWSWFQNKIGHPHYDLSPRKRTLAVQHGAIEVRSIELVKKCFTPKSKLMDPDLPADLSPSDRAAILALTPDERRRRLLGE